MKEHFFKNKPTTPMTPEEKGKKSEKLDLKIELAKPKDWAQYKDIKIESFKTNPDSFFEEGRPFTAKSEIESLSKLTKDDWISVIENENGLCVLAKIGLRIVGFISASGSLDETGTPEFNGTWSIRSFYVRPEFRGNSVGEELLVTILKELRAKGAYNVGGGILKTNKSGGIIQSLLEKAGFVREEDTDRSIIYNYDLTKK